MDPIFHKIGYILCSAQIHAFLKFLFSTSSSHNIFPSHWLLSHIAIGLSSMLREKLILLHYH